MYIVFSLQLLGVESRHIHAYLPREVRLALSIAEATLLDLSAAFDSTCENSVQFDPRVGKIAISVYALLLTASLVALFYCCDSTQFVAKPRKMVLSLYFLTYSAVTSQAYRGLLRRGLAGSHE